MNESQHTQQLLTLLKSRPDLVVQKHADRFTVGTPDVSVTGFGRTTWLEMKAPPKSRNLLIYISASMTQLHQMCRLDKPNGLAHYVCWEGNALSVWRPRYLMHLIRNNMFQVNIPYVDLSAKLHPHLMIQELYSPENGPIRFKESGAEAMLRLLTRSKND